MLFDPKSEIRETKRFFFILAAFDFWAKCVKSWIYNLACFACWLCVFENIWSRWIIKCSAYQYLYSFKAIQLTDLTYCNCYNIRRIIICWMSMLKNTLSNWVMSFNTGNTTKAQTIVCSLLVSVVLPKRNQYIESESKTRTLKVLPVSYWQIRW